MRNGYGYRRLFTPQQQDNDSLEERGFPVCESARMVKRCWGPHRPSSTLVYATMSTYSAKGFIVRRDYCRRIIFNARPQHFYCSTPRTLCHTERVIKQTWNSLSENDRGFSRIKVMARENPDAMDADGDSDLPESELCINPGRGNPSISPTFPYIRGLGSLRAGK